MAWEDPEANTINCFTTESGGAFTAAYLPVALPETSTAPDMAFAVGTSIASVCVLAMCGIVTWQARAGNVKVNLANGACKWMAEPFQGKKSRVAPTPIETPRSVPQLAWQASGLSALSSISRGHVSPKHFSPKSLQGREDFWNWARDLVGSASLPQLPYSQSFNFGDPASSSLPSPSTLQRAKSVPNFLSQPENVEIQESMSPKSPKSPTHVSDARDHFSDWTTDMRDKMELGANHSPAGRPGSACSVRSARTVLSSRSAKPELPELPGTSNSFMLGQSMASTPPSLPRPHFPPKPHEEKEEYFRSFEQEGMGHGLGPELRDIVGLGIPMLPHSPASRTSRHVWPPPPPPPKCSSSTRLAPKPPPHPPPQNMQSFVDPPMVEDAEHVEVRVDQAFLDWTRDFAVPTIAKATPPFRPPPPPLPRTSPTPPALPAAQAVPCLPIRPQSCRSFDPHEQNSSSSLRSLRSAVVRISLEVFCVFYYFLDRLRRMHGIDQISHDMHQTSSRNARQRKNTMLCSFNGDFHVASLDVRSVKDRLMNARQL
ncbi:galc [Symbiodinium natans]|uniref:Galc protein n=1 Tax=Symbiodinium natans TaxID=878477 RepID=A0A812QS13_9DINO|nr:galc [Symbiodinium natans]